MPTIPGIEQLSPTFRRKVDTMAARLGANPDDLLSIMSFETGGSFSPSEQNRAGSGATGLIQFTNATAQGLGTSTQALAQMTPEEQLDYVERHFAPLKGRLGSLKDAYMAVLYPDAVGSPDSRTLFREGTTAYRQNAPLDTAQKGSITVGDAVQAVQRFVGLAPATAEATPVRATAEATPVRARGDDLTWPYMQAYQVGTRARMQAEFDRLSLTEGMAPAQTPEPAPEPQSLWGRVGADLVQVPGGVRDAFVNSMRGLNLLGDWMREHGIGPDWKVDVHVPEIAHAGTTEGDTIRGAAQFVTGFLPATRIAQALGTTGLTANLFATAMSEFAAFAPESPRLSDTLAQLPGPLRNPLTTFLAHQPGDTEAESRLKRAVEGVGLGLLTHGVIEGAKAVWHLGDVERQAAPQLGGFLTSQRGSTGGPGSMEPVSPEVRAIMTGETPPAVRPPLTDAEIDAAAQTQLTEATARLAAQRQAADAAHAAVQAGDPQVIQQVLTSAGAVQAADGGTLLGRGTTLRRFASPQEAAQWLLDQRVERLAQTAEPSSPLAALKEALSPEEQAHPSQALPADVLRRFVSEREATWPTELRVSTTTVERLVRERQLPTAVALPPNEMERLIAARTLPTSQELPRDILQRLVQSRTGPVPLSPTVSFEVPDLLKERAQAFTSLEVSGAAEALPTEGRQLHINFDRITGPEELHQTIRTIAEVMQAEADTARRGVRTNAQTLAEASRNRYQHLEAILGIEPGTALNAEEATAVRSVFLTSAARLRDLSQRLAAGDDVYEDWLKQFALTANVHTIYQGVQAEAGRTLQAMGIELASTDRVFLDELGRAMAGLSEPTQQLLARIRPGALPTGEEAITPAALPTAAAGISVPRLTAPPEVLGEIRQIAARLASLPTDEQLARLMVGAHEVTRGDMFSELWYSSLMSNPPSLVVNALDGALRTLWAVPERFLAAGAGTGPIQMAEATHLVFGMRHALAEAWQYAKDAFRTGMGQFGDELSKVPLPPVPAFTAQNLGLQAGSMLGGTADLVGTAARTVGRIMLATDEFFKVINYRAQLHALAFREAAQAGLEGPALAARIAELVEHPGARLMEAARAFANYQTVNQALTTPGGAFESFAGTAQHLLEARNDWPFLKLFVPFVRTPFNIARYAAERTPLGLLSSNVRNAVLAGGAEGQLARAQMGLGTGMLALFGWMAQEGLITGGRPDDPHIAQTWERLGIQPYSVKIGNTYYAYNRVDLLGLPMGLAADFAHMVKELPSASLERIAGSALGAIWNNLTSKTYLQGIADVVSAVATPPTENERTSGKQFEQYFQRLAGSVVVPAGVAGVARMLDPTQRDVRSMFDQILSRLPGFSRTLPPAQDLWGRDRLRPEPWGPDLLSPILSRDYTPDAVDAELLRLQVPLAMPSKVVTIPRADSPDPDRIELTPAQYHRLVQLSAGEGLQGAQPLKAVLGEIIGSPAYRSEQLTDGPQGGRSLLLRSLVTEYRQAATAQLMSEAPDFMRLVLAKRAAPQLNRVQGGQETLQNLRIGAPR